MKQHTEISELQENEVLGEETARMKAAFTERAVTRIKEENARLQAKVKRLQEDIKGLDKQKAAVTTQVRAIELSLHQEKLKTAELGRALELRTRRYESDHHNTNVSRGEKAHYERGLAQKDAIITAMKDEYDLLNKKCHSLMVNLEKLQKLKARFELDAVEMAQKESKQIRMAQDLEALYLEKVNVLQTQNSQLKVQVESLILQLKLHERDKELSGLLSYENRIGSDSQLMNHRRGGSDVKKSQLLAQTFRQKGQSGGVEWLQSELAEQQQINSLLRQKNERLQQQLLHMRGRCATLQNIICTG